MTPSPYPATLKQLAPIPTGQSIYTLSPHQAIVIGRDRSVCQIVLDTAQGVSRRHAEIRPDNGGFWCVSDLGSSNGTYVNGQRLQSVYRLQSGDRLQLGQQGAEFVFEMQGAQTPMYAGGREALAQPIAYNPNDALHLSQMLPIVSTRQALLTKGYLIPGIATVLFVVSLFGAIGKPVLFNALLALFLATGGFYVIYQLSGKRKPWWLLIGVAIATIVLLVSPVWSVFVLVFRQILPGGIPRDPNIGFVPLLIHMFFGAGLAEELLKSLPVFGLLLLGQNLRSLRSDMGVWEPLDGIVLGAASAVGFTLFETLTQYVPDTVAAVAAQNGAGVGELLGIQLLIPRIVGSVFGHLAYSGYFGYFIGLSVLIGSQRWRVLGIGYGTAALLHALWNSVGALGVLAQAIVGILAYVFLMAAILKARQLSPNPPQSRLYRP